MRNLSYLQTDQCIVERKFHLYFLKHPFDTLRSCSFSECSFYSREKALSHPSFPVSVFTFPSFIAKFLHFSYMSGSCGRTFCSCRRVPSRLYCRFYSFTLQILKVLFTVICTICCSLFYFPFSNIFLRFFY